MWFLKRAKTKEDAIQEMLLLKELIEKEKEYFYIKNKEVEDLEDFRFYYDNKLGILFLEKEVDPRFLFERDFKELNLNLEDDLLKDLPDLKRKFFILKIRDKEAFRRKKGETREDLEENRKEESRRTLLEDESFIRYKENLEELFVRWEI